MGNLTSTGTGMTGERVKIVVWDSIGNTLLGVRPWALALGAGRASMNHRSGPS